VFKNKTQNNFYGGIDWIGKEWRYMKTQDVKFKTDSKLYKNFNGMSPFRQTTRGYASEVIQFDLDKVFINDLLTSNTLIIQYYSSPIDLTPQLKDLKSFLKTFKDANYDDMKRMKKNQ